MIVSKIERWLDDDGNAWGIGHHNKTAFAAWAREEYLAYLASSLMRRADDELYSLELHYSCDTYRACDVFHAWADMDADVWSELSFEPRDGFTSVTGLYA